MREARTLTILLVALIAIVVLSTATMGGMTGGLFGPMMGPGMMWGYGSQAGAPTIGGWGAAAAMGLGWLMMLAFWGALILGVVLLVRWLTGNLTENASADPLAILQRRYARGDIDEETYGRMRRELQPPPAAAESPDAIRRVS